MVTLVACLLILGCDQTPRSWVIHLSPQGQLTSEEMKVIFDAEIRAFPECRAGTIVYEDMPGMKVEAVTSKGELDRLTKSLAQKISGLGYGPVGTGWHEGEPDTTNLPRNEKRFVQVQELTQRGRDKGYDEHELGEILRHVNWSGASLMSDEDIGNIVVDGGALSDFAKLVFSSRKPYEITTGAHDGDGQPATRSESK